MRGEPGWGTLERVSRYLPAVLYQSCPVFLGVNLGTSYLLLGVAGQRASGSGQGHGARGCETQVACV